MYPATGRIDSPPDDSIASPASVVVISVTFAGDIVYRLFGYMRQAATINYNMAETA